MGSQQDGDRLINEPTQIVLLRHGHTSMSQLGLFVGSTDVRLNERGREAAAAWKNVFAGVENMRAWHSPLLRARESAELAGLPACSELDLLREWDLGDLEGREAERFRRERPDWNLFVQGPPRGTGESVHQVVARATRVAEFIREQGEGHDAVVLVGHGQFSRALVVLLLGWDISMARTLAWGPSRAAVLTWRTSVGGYVLTGWNRGATTWEGLTEGTT